jgi:hypothetical protein
MHFWGFLCLDATDSEGGRAHLSQYRACVATSRNEKHEKDWKRLIFTLILQRHETKTEEKEKSRTI